MLRRLALVFILSVCASVPAGALDCTKARSPVEIALCNDVGLESLDDRSSRTYFGLVNDLKANGFRRGGKPLDEVLRDDQRKWLAGREKSCGTLPPDKLRACIRDGLVSRIEDIGQRFEALARGDTLPLGAETLVVGDTDDGRKTLEHAGKVMVEASFSHDAQSGLPFIVLDRWSDATAQALLIESGAAATMQCSMTYVIETRAKGGVAAHELGSTCVAFVMNHSARTANGFSFIVPAAPASPGSVTEWDARTGTATTRALTFAPEKGTRMAVLLGGANAKSREPLENEEFFAAVEKLPEADRRRAKKALWQVTNGCDACGGTARSAVIIDAATAAYSGCGAFMQGARIGCSDDEVLAVWDRKGNSLYVAVDVLRPDGDHDARLYPSRDKWPAAALSRLEQWAGPWSK